MTVIANVFAPSVDDFVKLARRLSLEAGVHALELNISCPNVKEGGIEFGQDPRLAAQVTGAVRKATDLPLWVKMSPEAGDIPEVGRAVEAAGADALTAINTIRGMSIDPETGINRLHNRTGGLSGPALRPIALRIVSELVAAVSIPVIGIGGVSTVNDALEFLLAGAVAVQVGTATFADPCAAKTLVDELAGLCERRGVTVAGLIGSGRASQRSAPA